MAKKGDIINNPITKETMIFLKTAEETQGELLEIDMTVGPGGFVTAEHLHPDLEERFQILAGKIALSIEGKSEVVGVGEVRTVPKNTLHVWNNAGEEELKVILQFRPAGRMEYFLESWFALAEAGKTDRQGMPNLFQAAVIFSAFRGDVKPQGLLINILVKLLAPLGRLMGYQAYVSFSQVAPVRLETPSQILDKSS